MLRNEGFGLGAQRHTCESNNCNIITVWNMNAGGRLAVRRLSECESAWPG